MIWLTWRQFRLPALTVFGALGAIAISLAFSGPRLLREYNETVAGCVSRCSGAFDKFFEPRLGVYFGLNLLVVLVPIVAGLFWGAPLISREFETGTHELVWQQSVPARRWLAVKVGLVGLAAIAAAGIFAMVVTWWARPLDATAFTGVTRLSPALFDARGYVAAGHAAFAFALGLTAGLLIRRTLPAMAVTFVVIVALQILMPSMVRPYFATPDRLEIAITAANMNGIDYSGPNISGLLVDAGPRDAWVLTNETVDSTGRAVKTLPDWVAECATPDQPSGEVAQSQCLQRLNTAGYRQAVTYHAADRFWAFQAYETAIFAVLSALLLAFCFLRIRPS